MICSVSQAAVLGAADQRGDRAAAQATGSAEKVRVRDTAVFRHSRLQRLLCRSRGLERRHENRQDAQPALHGFRRAHRPEEKPKRLQGMYYNTTYFAYTAAAVLNDNIIMRTKIEKIFTAAFTHISNYIYPPIAAPPLVVVARRQKSYCVL